MLAFAHHETDLRSVAAGAEDDLVVAGRRGADSCAVSLFRRADRGVVPPDGGPCGGDSSAGDGVGALWVVGL